MTALAILYLLAFVRCYGFFSMLPQLGEMEMPTGVKFALIGSITPFLVAPALAHGVDAMPHLSAGILILVGKELLLGMFIGFLVGLPLRLPQLIGDLVDNQRGAAVTSQFNPALGEDASILGQLLLMCLSTYFFSEGGLDRLVGILSGSFTIQSPASFEFSFGDDFKSVALVIIQNYLHLFVILALPVMVVMLLSDFTLGLASKFAQSLNVFSLSQSVKAVVAIAMLISMHPKMMHAYLQFFNQVEEVFS